jgi:ribA/ribD-fused uncharacterized protein
MSEPILGFSGPNRFMSNFIECSVDFEGINFPSTEHAYVAAKTLDLELRKEISQVNTAGQVKRLGRALTLRLDWEEIKIDVMHDLLMQKFSKEPFKSLLLSTKDSYLEETNHWGDVVWGVCNGIGQNNLGKLLMKIRKDLNEITKQNS